MMIKCFSALGLVILATACVTDGKKSFEESRVLERIGGKSSTPEWADGTKAMFDEGADVIFVSQMSMGANARTEACLKGAELDGRSAMLRYVKENITASGQLNETDSASDPAFEALTAFLSQSKLSGVSAKERYWEKVEMSDENADRVLKIRCAVKLAIKKSELQRQLREATAANGGNPKIREALLNAQTEFLNNIDSQPSH